MHVTFLSLEPVKPEKCDEVGRDVEPAQLLATHYAGKFDAHCKAFDGFLVATIVSQIIGAGAVCAG